MTTPPVYAESDPFGKIRLNDDDVIHTESDVVISLRNVHKTYLLGIEGVPALRGVSLSIKKGEFVTIFGTSGGGKTTMLNVVGTIDKQTKGDLFLCGSNITNKTKDRDLSILRNKKMGFVFQTFNLLASLTAIENVELPMILLGELSAQERKQRAIELLEAVGMGKRLSHLPSQLSGGEQQRVTIARAMANKPELLLLDEPTGDLDSRNTAIVMGLLSKLNKDNGITMVMVTHDVSLKHFADKVVWMRDGLVQRVEVVNEQLRTECRERFSKSLEEDSNKKVEKSVIFEERDPHFYIPVDYKVRRHERRKLGILFNPIL
eukprot:TRINITY_DN2283_c0_g1_i2.p1 TRINITY_DN2283_c0_g1~~TRINITY_DN2283_c0_g1_i2.p1  ORF type:complete len:319 (+),score=81.20 TRINITY_DN2283_c0_g1_i2:122-1078(+)